MNATQSDIEKRLARLSDLLYGNENMLIIEKWSPGDGWTRWRICDRGHRYPFGERNYRKSELYEALGLALNVAWAMKAKHESGNERMPVS